MRCAAVIGLAWILAAGCQSPEPAQPAVPAPRTASAPAPEAATPQDLQPLPQRLALPLPVLDMRLRDPKSAGQLFQPDVSDPVALQAVGLNLCQTGYVLQAYFRDDANVLQTTPPLPLPVLREGRYVHRDANISDQRIETDFEEASLKRLRGTLRILDEATGAERLKLAIDTVPIGIASGPGLGPQGCFTTGTWQIEDDLGSFAGPTSAVWDNKVLHWVGLRLDEQHTIDFWVTIAPQHRQPGRILRGDLERIGQEPRKFPFRVVFRTREADGSVTELPAEAGTLTAAFTRANPQGPLKIELNDLKVPEWKGPFAGQTLDTVRAETLIVTDLRGSQVPIPGTGEAQK